jgi:hypothetical protein
VHEGDVAGTAGALDETEHDFESGDPSAVKLFREIRDDIEADTASHEV